ncbi:alanine racemase [Paeniglutamicibacter gangotriensis]|uniref:Alanine racemase n=1 Tax=Paeniglutamicibacter gangotriensis Lz1y TaxID=1276920 RepID=M7NCI9_9MICC|nr:alanine racemase [Paeniglutamicibacter gangotriensis]EMQ99539.1 alanine racemase [Paeniglutamicibacter gangotriensis Lz1y]
MTSSWERRAVIDLANIRENVKRVGELVAPAAIMGVVKADGYGHGAIAVGRAAVQAGATWLGCAHVTEALKIRDAGIEVPMLAWLHTLDTPFAQAISANIDLAVSGWELDHVARAAQEAAQPARVHLKIDTGLGRNGSAPADWETLLDRASSYQDEGLMRVVGVFSHLAVADEPERPETDEQLEAFNQAVALAEDAGFDLEVRHIANTPAILSRPDSHYDLVRLGLGMYGMSPFVGEEPERYGLRPAMTLTSRIANVKKVPAGSGVGYGLRYHTSEETYLGLVPMGYADGIPRSALNAPVSINGKTYLVRGTIAMDQFVVDLGPDIDVEAMLGSEVILFGQGGPSITEWADAAGTINYEIATRVSPRVPRRCVEGTWGESGE